VTLPRAILAAHAPADPRAGAAAGPAGTVAESPLEWTYQPWREHPGRAAAGTVGALGLCVLALQLGLPALTAGLLCLVMVSLLAPLFVPVRCRLDAEGIAVAGPQGWTRRAWSDVRRAKRGPRGLRVSPFSRRSWMDPYRAMFLPFPADRADALGRAVDARLAEHELET